MFYKTLSIAVVAVVLAGCALEQDEPETSTELSLFQRLATRETLTLEPTSLVGVVASDEAGNVLPCVQPTVISGDVVLRGTTRGLVIIEALNIELSDVKVDEGVLDNDKVVFTDIRLRLGTQLVLDPEWGKGWHSAVGGGQADMLLDWSVIDKSGDRSILDTQKLSNANFAVDVSLDYDGSILANVTMSVDGELGSVADHIMLSDFSMAINARTLAPSVD